jgi:FAD/FMN-containing dehydrogenase
MLPTSTAASPGSLPPTAGCPIVRSTCQSTWQAKARRPARSPSGAQAKELWRIREAIVEAQNYSGSIKHDVSVPVSRVAEFIVRAGAAVTERLPGMRPIAFGHVGDGNIHFNLTQPDSADTAAYLARWQEFNDIVHGVVRELHGSISAEHGVGRLKRDEITHYKSPVEIELMRAIKRALDPNNIMNPDKVVQV